MTFIALVIPIQPAEPRAGGDVLKGGTLSMLSNSEQVLVAYLLYAAPNYNLKFKPPPPPSKQ